MATNPPSDNVRDHGIIVDDKKKRVKCNYCGKEVTGFSRLKYHLGGVRGDVLPCLEVLEDVKIVMRSSLIEKKKTTLSKEVLHLFDSDAPPKENLCATSSKLNQCQLKSARPTVTGKRKHTVVEPLSKLDMMDSNLSPPRRAAKSREFEDDASNHAQRCIGKFLYENGIDFSTVESQSFRNMIIAAAGSRSAGFKVPTCNDLQGWIFEDEMADIHNYVQQVRQSWQSTGCSILLDGWTDEKGRNLINFIVDCARGPIYLKSADISNALTDVNAMVSVLDGVIEEVGVENVVQVLTYNTSSFMEAVGKQMIDKYKSIFWGVCASHCICLMVENIGMMSPINEVLSKAKTIVDFIYSHARVLKFVRMYTDGRDLVIPSRIRSVEPFLTLENIVAEEINLKNAFNSSMWKGSTWASTHGGRRVVDLVEDPSFWSAAEMALKATIPLVRALRLISGEEEDNKPQVGYIYETMDQAKETIKKEFKNKKALYRPFWETIDEVWNKKLYNPLHAAGYFLNPSFFYSVDFLADAEVASGLMTCLVRMAENRGIQDSISLQMDEFREANGSFGDSTAVAQRTEIPAAKWWSLYGEHCPELQRFAVRILSQTCIGAFRFYLKRSLSEQLHANGRNSVEQQKLNDLTYLGHNLRLRHSLAVESDDNNHVILEDRDPMADQAVQEQQVNLARDEQGANHENDSQQENFENYDFADLMCSDRIFVDAEAPSYFQPKDEAVGDGDVQAQRHAGGNGGDR